MVLTKFDLSDLLWPWLLISRT